MAKKKLILNESTTRMFMKYADIKPTYVANFLTEAEEEDEMEMEMGADLAPPEDSDEAPEMDAELGAEDEMEMEMDAEEPDGSGAEGLVMSLLAKIQEFAEENGVSMELEGEEEEGMEDDMMDAAPDGGDLGMPDDSEVDADLEAADVDMEEPMDDEEIIAEVTRRVARRLLRESAKRK